MRRCLFCSTGRTKANNFQALDYAFAWSGSNKCTNILKSQAQDVGCVFERWGQGIKILKHSTWYTVSSSHSSTSFFARAIPTIHMRESRSQVSMPFLQEHIHIGEIFKRLSYYFIVEQWQSWPQCLHMHVHVYKFVSISIRARVRNHSCKHTYNKRTGKLISIYLKECNYAYMNIHTEEKTCKRNRKQTYMQIHIYIYL